MTVNDLKVKVQKAEEAVNHVRELYGENITGIIEVAKVVNNWK